MNGNGYKSGSNLERVFEAGHFAVTAELGPPKSADVSVIEKKAAHLEGNVDAEELCLLLERRAEAAVEDPERLANWTGVARLAAARLEDPARAAGLWRRVLELSPLDPEALEQLAALHQAQRDWAGLADVLERQADAASGDRTRATVLRRLAALRREELSDLAGAERAWKAVLALVPEDDEARAGLQGIGGEREDWGQVVGLLERRLHTETGEARLATLKRLAEVRAGALGDVPAAITALEEARSLAPTDRTVLAELRELYEAAGDPGQAVETIAVEFESSPDADVVPLCLDAARLLWRELDLPEQAVEWYERVREREPARRDVLLELRVLYTDLGLDDRLEDVLRSLLEQAGNDAERVALAAELGRRAEAADRPEEAFDHYEAAHRLQPRREEFLLALRRLAAQSGLHARLLPVLERLTEATRDPAERILRLRETAALRERRLRDEAGAFADLRRALALDPGRMDTREAIEALAQRTGCWRPLVEALRELASRAGPAPARVALHRRAATILEQEAGDPAGAFEELVTAFRLEPRDEAVEAELVRLGEERWDRLLEVLRGVADVVEDPGLQARLLAGAARLQDGQLVDAGAALSTLAKAFLLDPSQEHLPEELETLARSQDEVADVVALYGRVAADAPPPLELSLRRRAAGLLLEDLDAGAEAIPHLHRIWKLAPGDGDSARRLREQLTAAARWEDLIEVLVTDATRAADPPARIERLLEVAEVRARHLGQPRSAIATLEHVLRLAPEHPGALQALEGVHEALDEPERVVHVLEARAARTADPQVARSLRLRAAACWRERLDRPERARAVYRGLLAQDPDDKEALEALEGLCRQESWWEELLGVLELRAARTADREERVELLWRMARIADDRLEDRVRAVGCLTDLLALDPAHGRAADRLAARYREEGRVPELLALLERRLARCEEGPERAEVLLQVGALREEHLEDQEAAISAYEEARTHARQDARPLVALHRLHLTTGRWQQAVETGRALAASAGPSWEAAGVLFGVGVVLLGRLGAADDALEALADAVSWDPGRAKDLEGQRGVARELGRTDVELALLELEEAHAGSDERRADLFCERGRLLEQEHADAEQAATCYEQALELCPDHRRALVALADARLALKDLPAVERCLERTAEVLGDPEPGDVEHAARLAEVWTRRGLVALELGERKAAIERLYRALKLDPEARRPRRVLADLATEAERWPIALEHLQILCGSPAPEDDAATVAGWHARLAECLEHLDQPEEAAAAWRDAVECHPETSRARRGLLEALWGLECWEEAAGVLSALVATEASDVATRRADLQRLGELLTDRLGRQDEGLVRFEEASRLAPEDPELLRRLLDGHHAAGDAGSAADAAAALAVLAERGEDALAAHLTHGELALAAERPGEAAAAYAQALDLAPTDEGAALGLATARSALGDVRGAADGLDRHVEALRSEGREAASEVLRRRVEVLSEDPAARRERREALRAVLARTPADPEALQALFDAWQREGNADRAFVVADLLVYLRAASQEVERFHGEYSGWLGGDDVRALPAEVRRDHVDDPDEHGPVGRVLETLLQAVPDLVGGAAAEAVLASADRIDTRPKRALAKHFERVAEALGVPGRALYVRREGGTALEVVPGAPPALVVGGTFSRHLIREEQRFHLARGLALTERARPLARALTATEGQALLEALRGRTRGRAFGWRERLAESLDEGLRESLAGLLDEAAGGGFEGWAAAVERSAARTAFALVTDLGTVFRALRRELPRSRARPLRSAAAVADLAQRLPLVADVLGYLLSDGFDRVRRGG